MKDVLILLVVILLSLTIGYGFTYGVIVVLTTQTNLFDWIYEQRLGFVVGGFIVSVITFFLFMLATSGDIPEEEN